VKTERETDGFHHTADIWA